MFRASRRVRIKAVATTVIDQRSEGLTRTDLLTPEEAAHLLAVPRKTILRWAAAGYIPAHKLGRRWRLVRAEIDRWVLDDTARRSA